MHNNQKQFIKNISYQSAHNKLKWKHVFITNVKLWLIALRAFVLIMQCYTVTPKCFLLCFLIPSVLVLCCRSTTHPNRVSRVTDTQTCTSYLLQYSRFARCTEKSLSVYMIPEFTLHTMTTTKPQHKSNSVNFFDNIVVKQQWKAFPTH